MTSITYSYDSINEMIDTFLKMNKIFPKDHKLDISWNDDRTITITDLCAQHGDNCLYKCSKVYNCSKIKERLR